jgi:hypothetical protein
MPQPAKDSTLLSQWQQLPVALKVVSCTVYQNRCLVNAWFQLANALPQFSQAAVAAAAVVAAAAAAAPAPATDARATAMMIDMCTSITNKHICQVVLLCYPAAST